MYRCGSQVSNGAARGQNCAVSGRGRSLPPVALVISAGWAFAVLLTPQLASACSCEPPPPVPQALREAVSVFEGRVAQASTDGPSHRATLRVVQRWKGADRERFEVEVDTMCGFVFEVGVSYLVYTQASAGGETVSLCSRTRPLADAAADLHELGAGSTPVNPSVGPGATPLPRAEIAPGETATAGGGTAQATGTGPATGTAQATGTAPLRADGRDASEGEGCAVSRPRALPWGTLLFVLSGALVARRRRRSKR